jgi:hypothetical protein
MISVISVGISFPKNILARIDSERGDIPRSRYLLRVIENTLEWKENVRRKGNFDSKETTQDPLDVDLEACNQASQEVHKRSDLS